jgi:hypothetical protein
MPINYSGQGGPMGLWDAVRPALVALDPIYMGDETALCTAYGAGDYAPDLLEDHRREGLMKRQLL